MNLDKSSPRKMGNGDTRKWSEWDREGRKLEMTLTHSNNTVRITIGIRGDVIAHLNATVGNSTLKITDFLVHQGGQISIYRRQPGEKTSPIGRNSGHGSLIIRALTEFARKNAIVEITGVILKTHIAETPHLLEWFSERQFIVGRASPSDSAQFGIAARVRKTT